MGVTSAGGPTDGSSHSCIIHCDHQSMIQHNRRAGHYRNIMALAPLTEQSLLDRLWFDISLIRKFWINVLFKSYSYIVSINLYHKSQSVTTPYFTDRKHHSGQKYAHFCSEWYIVEYETRSLWHLLIWSIALSDVQVPLGQSGDQIWGSYLYGTGT